MKAILALLAFVTSTLASDVLEFTDSDFSSRIAEHELILVEFLHHGVVIVRNWHQNMRELPLH